MHDTAALLSQHFMKERLQYGLYGLYPKYRIYNEPLVMFLGMVGHALVVLTLQCDRGSLADQRESIHFIQFSTLKSGFPAPLRIVKCKAEPVLAPL